MCIRDRCNITNSSDMDVLFNSVMTNRKFLYSAFYAYDNQMVIDFFEQAGPVSYTHLDVYKRQVQV